MKINLENKTHWRDDHIRAFVQRVAQDERPDLCKRGAPALKVKVVYTRNHGRGSSGYAYYHSNFIKVRLQKHGQPDKVDFAFVIAHELAHTRGVRHNAMRGNSLYRRVGSYRQNYAWADALPLEVTPTKTKVRPTADVKLLHAEKMLKAAMTREKRATTLRKKWEQKVKYYQKKAAEPPKPPKAPEPVVQPEPQPDPRPSTTVDGFTVKSLGDGEYEVFAKDGFNLGDGTHSRIAYGINAVRETMNFYRGSLEECGADCDCRV